LSKHVKINKLQWIETYNSKKTLIVQNYRGGFDVLVPIDWHPFRTAIVWKISTILTDEIGEQATSVFADAQQMLAIILKEKKFC
jgi:5-methyltetrahydrofolate--homocysteine methyltransferase